LSGIDWMNTPLAEFRLQHEFGKDGRTTGRMVLPHGVGKAQDVLRGLQYVVEETYIGLLSPEDLNRLEEQGEVPVIREDGRRYEPMTHSPSGTFPPCWIRLRCSRRNVAARRRRSGSARPPSAKSGNGYAPKSAAS
jgi:hypothetical protein